MDRRDLGAWVGRILALDGWPGSMNSQRSMEDESMRGMIWIATVLDSCVNTSEDGGKRSKVRGVQEAAIAMMSPKKRNKVRRMDLITLRSLLGFYGFNRCKANVFVIVAEEFERLRGRRFT